MRDIALLSRLVLAGAVWSAAALPVQAQPAPAKTGEPLPGRSADPALAPAAEPVLADAVDEEDGLVSLPSLRHLSPETSLAAAAERERAIGAAVRALLQQTQIW